MKDHLIKKNVIKMCFILSTLFFLVEPAYGQVDAYTINLRRNFGYGGGVNIRGTFTIHLVGDETKVQKVTFLIDDKEMASVDVEPFTYRFNTDDYGFGTHRLSAEVHLLDGSTQRTPESQYNFVSSEEVRRQVGTLVGGLVGVIVFIVVIIAAVQFLFHKKKRNQVRQPGETPNYGMLGGTICPKCGQPFPRHLWGVNLLVGRLDRCDHCGKWVMTVRATPAAIKLAEEAEQEDKTKVFNAGQSNKELKDQLEDTKYIDQL